MRNLLSRKPVATETHNYATGSATTSAWRTIITLTSEPASAVEIFDSSGRILEIATGDIGSEVTMPYTIIPGGSSVILPLEFKHSVRVAVKAVDEEASTGYLVMNFFA